MGAWIETGKSYKMVAELWVAPCVGAWIETGHGYNERGVVKSRPAWARGLKHRKWNTRSKRCRVAPCVGAWIETYQTIHALHL